MFENHIIQKANRPGVPLSDRQLTDYKMSGEHKDGKTTWNKPEKFKWAEGGKKDFEKADEMKIKYPPDKKSTPEDLESREKAKVDKGFNDRAWPIAGSKNFHEHNKKVQADPHLREKTKRDSAALVGRQRAEHKIESRANADHQNRNAMEGMRNLHKAMCPVIKGLSKLLKGLGSDLEKGGFTPVGRATTAHQDFAHGRHITNQSTENAHDWGERDAQAHKKHSKKS